MTAWAISRPLRTMVLVMLPATAISIGIAWLEFESNYIRIFKARSRVASDYDFVETRMGGIGIVELILPAPEKMTHEWIHRLDESTARLAAQHPDVVTKVLTLADVVRESPSESADSETAAADAQRVLDTKLRLLNSAVYSHFVKNFWNASNRKTRILVRIRETVGAESKQQTFDQLAAQLREAMSVDSVEVTGLSHLMTQVTRAIITTQFQSAGWSALIILIMLWIALRKLRLAVLALLPTCLAVGLVLGVMGWLNVRIDLSTAMVTSIALGLSVDDTFHCLLGWQRELRAGRATLDALRASFAGTGPGVILSSSAVSLGFLALMFSEFVPTANFGWLIAVATLGGSLGNLLILPASLALMSGSIGPSGNGTKRL